MLKAYAIAKQGEVSVLGEEIRQETTDNRVNFFMRECLNYSPGEAVSSSLKCVGPDAWIGVDSSTNNLPQL